jgi:hypothetical protein
MADKYTTFGELDIGAYFFDEVSGEYWKKDNLTTASIMSGHYDGTDIFQIDEYVIVEVE